MNASALKALSVPVSYVPRSGPLVRLIAPRSGTARQRFRGGAMFDLDLSDRIQAESFVRRGYDSALCRWILRRTGSGDLFVDAGANVGLVSFTVGMGGARVLAFEPLPANCERWRANRALNPHVIADLVQAAVSDRAGTARFDVPPGGESGWGHIAEDGVEVPLVTLDEALDGRRVSVLKLDIEGHEPAALRGAEALLAAGRIGAIVCEVNEGFESTGETLAMLAECGYRREQVTRLDSAFVL